MLTGLGLRGSPGMGLTSALMFAIDGAGLSASVAVITDGQMSGLVNGGLVVAEVAPEGAAGGPLGLVRDGDMISIDVNARRIDLEVDAGELDRRRAELPPLAAPAGCGWLSVYARTVAPLGARRDAQRGACELLSHGATGTVQLAKGREPVRAVRYIDKEDGDGRQRRAGPQPGTR